jgi:epimerase transport system membrane fusion protein
MTGMPYFLARIRVTPESYEKLGDLKLMPGMPADALIKTGERTVFEYLIQPASNAIARSFIED